MYKQIPKMAPIRMEPEKITKICFGVLIKGLVSKSVLQHLSHSPKLINSVKLNVKANVRAMPTTMYLQKCSKFHEKRKTYIGTFAPGDKLFVLTSRKKLKIPDKNTLRGSKFSNIFNRIPIRRRIT